MKELENFRKFLTNEALSKGSDFKDENIQKRREKIMKNHDVEEILKAYIKKENLPSAMLSQLSRWKIGKDARIDGVLVDDIINKSIK
jgi:hypothetical protein